MVSRASKRSLQLFISKDKKSFFLQAVTNFFYRILKLETIDILVCTGFPGRLVLKKKSTISQMGILQILQNRLLRCSGCTGFPGSFEPGCWRRSGGIHWNLHHHRCSGYTGIPSSSEHERLLHCCPLRCSGCTGSLGSFGMTHQRANSVAGRVPPPRRGAWG